MNEIQNSSGNGFSLGIFKPGGEGELVSVRHGKHLVSAATDDRLVF